jgi:hypothetical protein
MTNFIKKNYEGNDGFKGGNFNLFWPSSTNCIKTLLLLQPILGGHLILCIIDDFDFKKHFKIKRIVIFT